MFNLVRLLIPITICLFFSLNIFAASFHIDPIDKSLESALTAQGIWQEGCPVPLSELRILSVNYWDLQGRAHQGQMILHQSVADAALNTFQKLYDMHFPFTKIDTLISFNGDWQKAEAHNVTYGFICRQDNNHFSPESYAKTITMNPVLNPEFTAIEFLQQLKITPKTGIFAINRSLKIKGMTEAAESILRAQGFNRAKNTKNQMSWKKFVLSKNENEPVETGSFLTEIKDKSAPKLVFQYEPLSDLMKEKIIASQKWHDECPVTLDRLNLIRFSYWDFNGQTQTGHIIVFDALAPNALMALKELYMRKFPIETPDLDTDDLNIASTGAFNCRPLTGDLKTFSLHAYGLAIDINIHRNPYIGGFAKNSNGDFLGSLGPYDSFSFSYINRQPIRLGMNEQIENIMKKYGFMEWGGNWEDRVDYMHFQVPKNLAKNMVYLDINSAKLLLALSIQYPEAAKKMSTDQRWHYLYRFYPKEYMKVLSLYFSRLQSEKESEVMNRVYLDLINSRE